ncbi:MAG: tRNA-dihydrouridine synthase, partial [Bacteroidales bacterium]|nr:tRNA-dihydrouridine synthase [Bacteroidales bacterium]
APLYGGTADWNLIGQVKNNPRMHIPVFGNGDIDSAQKAVEMRQHYGVDGVLIGRAAIGNPWIFRQVKHFMETGKELPLPSVQERKEICMQLFEKETECKGERVAAQEMKIHYSGFFKGLPGFKPVKMKLMLSSSMREAQELLESYPE